MRVYVASRLRRFLWQGRERGEAANLAHARQLVRAVALLGHEPYAPHVAMAGVLDDLVPAEREAGIRTGLRWLACADELWFDSTFGISEGMAGELEEAARLGLRIVQAWTESVP